MAMSSLTDDSASWSGWFNSSASDNYMVEERMKMRIAREKARQEHKDLTAAARLVGKREHEALEEHIKGLTSPDNLWGSNPCGEKEYTKPVQIEPMEPPSPSLLVTDNVTKKYIDEQIDLTVRSFGEAYGDGIKVNNPYKHGELIDGDKQEEKQDDMFDREETVTGCDTNTIAVSGDSNSIAYIDGSSNMVLGSAVGYTPQLYNYNYDYASASGLAMMGGSGGGIIEPEHQHTEEQQEPLEFKKNSKQRKLKL